ncbi:glutaredoxin family protein [Pleionea sp. CnH1-48]|uniref:glutaredoxin family protein n=1 Tax=Pleionea sp. CnH1-48 TaxID=2954494 RepID=UPI002097661B|nr:glutaredoxin family protein [Pleionea sp. CnH1-48]MCO7225336.1 glutaredoxin family protein [Pleionea sp. CnH1-48]
MVKTTVIFLIGAMGFFGNIGEAAQIYKWRDKDGKLHYSDKPPAEQKVEEVELGPVNTYTNVSTSKASRYFQQMTKQHKVIMYSAEWCGVCKKARRYFKQNNIAFTELDIDKSKQARRDYKRLNARGVPVILVGRQRMNGFSKAGFEQIYKKGKE